MQPSKSLEPAGPPEGGSATRPATAVTVVGIAAGDGDGEIVIPAIVARAVGLVDADDVTVRTGSGSASARIRVEEGGTALLAAPSLAGALSLPAGMRLHVRYDPDRRELRLGPFVGILALRARRGPMYGDHEPFFQALTRQGRRLAVPAFMFSPRDVRWQERRIDGWVFLAAPHRFGRWSRRTFPLPDVIYDRVQTRRAEGRPAYGRFRRRMMEHVTAWFNEGGFFDKWRLHALLWNNEQLQRYLPDTRRYTDAGDLEHMVQKYAVAYVKPVAGSLGAGIVKVRRIGRRFAVTYEIGERPVTRVRPTAASAHQLLSRLMRGRPYIVQQGLPLARWNRRPFDIRILMQRGPGGEWVVTKMFSRIAAPGGITSNLTRGADACNIHLLLRRVFGAKHRAALYRRLAATGIHCAREIAATLPGTVGELGLDLGMSRSGRIWLIEANSKPFLQMTREAGSLRTLQRSVRRPLQYAKHLAGW